MESTGLNSEETPKKKMVESLSSFLWGALAGGFLVFVMSLIYIGALT